MTCQICRCDELRMHHAVPVMLFALRECASRLRYDGDHHHDLGLDSRRDASWEAMRLAEAALAMATGDFQSMGEPVVLKPLTSNDEGEPDREAGLSAGSPMGDFGQNNPRSELYGMEKIYDASDPSIMPSKGME